VWSSTRGWASTPFNSAQYHRAEKEKPIRRAHRSELIEVRLVDWAGPLEDRQADRFGLGRLDRLPAHQHIDPAEMMCGWHRCCSGSNDNDR
jgi:hypothetical protein